jgi:hypothetical protein
MLTAWAAGLFEGEGCICLTRRRDGRMQAMLTLKMTDRDVVDRFHKIVGYGTVRESTWYRKVGYAPQWEWRIGSWKQVKSVLHTFRPFFGERRGAKADNVLQRMTEYKRDYGRA